MEELPKYLKEFRSKLDQDQSMSVPDGYFDNLTKSVLDRLDTDPVSKPVSAPKNSPSWWQLRPTWRWSIAVALVITAIVVMPWKDNSEDGYFADVELDEMEDYLVTYANDLDWNDLADDLMESDDSEIDIILDESRYMTIDELEYYD